MPDNVPSILFVGGSGRSGTSILNAILGRHPDVAVTPPLRFMIDPDGVLPFLDLLDAAWTPYAADRACKRLARLLRRIATPLLPGRVTRALRPVQQALGRNLTPAYAHQNATAFCPDFPRLAKRFLDEIRAFTYDAMWVGSEFWEAGRMAHLPPGAEHARRAAADFYNGFASSALQHHRAGLLADRNTWNILWFDRLRNLLPQSRLLHIHRDPRDVVASFMTQRWTPADPVHAALVYRDVMDRWEAVRQRIPGDSHLAIALEDLAADPEATLKGVCAFAGLDWSERLLGIPLDRANSGRWRRDIPAETLPRVLDILNPWLDALGYGQND